jgi:hypothetical protein
MPKRKKPFQKRKEGLDRGQRETRRGRPGASGSEIALRAGNFRRMLWTFHLDTKRKEWVPDKPQEWTEQLLSVQTDEDRLKALDSAPLYVQNEFKPLAPLILKVVKEPRFPKRREAQTKFLADSLAGLGKISPRRSRDICERERARERRKSPYKIFRHEFYVECSCGYKGPARDNACRKCGAEIPMSLEKLWDNLRFF